MNAASHPATSQAYVRGFARCINDTSGTAIAAITANRYSSTSQPISRRASASRPRPKRPNLCKPASRSTPIPLSNRYKKAEETKANKPSHPMPPMGLPDEPHCPINKSGTMIHTDAINAYAVTMIQCKFRLFASMRPPRRTPPQLDADFVFPYVSSVWPAIAACRADLGQPCRPPSKKPACGRAFGSGHVWLQLWGSRLSLCSSLAKSSAGSGLAIK